MAVPIIACVELLPAGQMAVVLKLWDKRRYFYNTGTNKGWTNGSNTTIAVDKFLYLHLTSWTDAGFNIFRFEKFMVKGIGIF